MSDPAEAEAAHTALEVLKQDAVSEEANGFDASATTVQDMQTDGWEHSSHQTATTSSETDVTSLSNGIRSIDFETSSDPGHEPDKECINMDFLTELDNATKVAILVEIFPDIGQYTIDHTIKKCNGKWERAIDELLNHSVIHLDTVVGESKIMAKGVDAFSEDNTRRRGRRKKEKRKKHLTDVDDVRSSSLPNATTASGNAWKTGAMDIDFIATRISLPKEAVSSAYYNHSASIVNTITALLDTNILDVNSAQTTSSDPDTQAMAFQLGQEFPAISASHLTALIRLTHPSAASAHELAKIMTKPTSPKHIGGIEIVTRHTPIETLISDEDTSPRPPTNRRGATILDSHRSGIDPNTMALAFQLAGSRAKTQARAASRRSKSDGLYGGAAAYYSQVGREYSAQCHQARSNAADVLVESQSDTRAGLLDLHGVTIPDAMRITRAKTINWWHAIGMRGNMGVDGRVMRDAGSMSTTLRIVTGMGRHSAGGVSRIGPAVEKTLTRDGWIFGYNEGVYIVSGKKR